MAGLFDDLIPRQGAAPAGGLFDDLIPDQSAAAAPVARPFDVATGGPRTAQADTRARVAADYASRSSGQTASPIRAPRTVMEAAHFFAQDPGKLGDFLTWYVKDKMKPIGEAFGFTMDHPAEAAGAAGKFARDVVMAPVDAFRQNAEQMAGGADYDPALGMISASAMLPGLPRTVPAAAVSRTIPPRPLRRPIGGDRAGPIAGATERLGDIEAFRRLEIEPFGPALGDKGSARFARTIEEMPIVGAQVKTPKVAVEEALANERVRMGQRLGAPASDEMAGIGVQRGLDRFKNSGIADIEPGVLRQLGINPVRPARPRDVMSQEAARRAATAQEIRASTGPAIAHTSRGAQVQAAVSRGQTLTARKTAVDLTDAQLQRLVRTPARETSFAVRQEALYERAWRQIPLQLRRDSSRNPQRLAAVNTRQALAQIDGNIAAEIISQGRISGELAERIRNPHSHFSLGDIRAIRTEVGRALSGYNPQVARLDQTQLRQLYAALSRDMEVGLTDLANRALIQSRLPAGAPDFVPLEVATRAEGALRAFRAADRYTRVGMERMDRFMQVLGARSPEEAARRIGRYLRENTQDVGALRMISSSLRPEEWRSVVGHVLGSLGRGRAGAVEAEGVFNVSHWLTDFERLSPASRNVLLTALTPTERQALADFRRVVARMKYYETTRNYSGTGYTLGGLSVAGVTVGTVGTIPGLMAGIAATGGLAAIGRFMTSRSYVRWLERAYRAGASGGPPRLFDARQARLLTELVEIARGDPEIGIFVLRALAPAGIETATDAED